MPITRVQEEPAEYDGWSPGCFLIDTYGNVLARLPLRAWPQVRAWHRDPHARPLMIRDPHSSQITSFDRSMITRVDFRDLDASVLLEAKARDDASRWSQDHDK